MVSNPVRSSFDKSTNIGHFVYSVLGKRSQVMGGNFLYIRARPKRSAMDIPLESIMGPEERLRWHS